MNNDNYGQALISLVFFVLIGLTITTAAVILAVTNSQTTTNLQQGTLAYNIAEGGAENALMRLLRDPSYPNPSPDVVSIDGGTASITVTSGSNPVIVSTGQLDNFVRKIQVDTTYNNGQLVVTSWKEIY